MLKRFMVTGTYKCFVNAADVDEAREIAIANAEKAFDNDYAGMARIDLSDPDSIEFFRELIDGN